MSRQHRSAEGSLRFAQLVGATLMALLLSLVFAGVGSADPGKGPNENAAPQAQANKPEGEPPHGNAYGQNKADKPAKPKAKPRGKSKGAPYGKAKGKGKANAKAKGGDGKGKAGGPDGKTTICHSTGSATNPYVLITVSNNAIPAHKRHHDGRDIIPAPAEGCPKAGDPPPAGGGTTVQGQSQGSEVKNAEAQRTEGKRGASQRGVLGANAQNSPNGDSAGAGAGNAGEGDGNAGTQAAARSDRKFLPFTGLELLAIAGLGALALGAGLAARRWAHSRSV